MFFVSLQKYCGRDVLLFFFLPHFEYHVAPWLEDLLEMSKNFEAHIHWKSRLVYFYYWCNPAKYKPAKHEGGL
jgi:hypothetical protein